MKGLPGIDNKKPNFTKVYIGRNTFYFSYQTCIAAWNSEKGLIISANVWGNTTGKHLNMVNSDKTKRIPNSEFCEIVRDLEW